MSERDLNRAVARATGETVETIQERGFGITAANGHDDSRGPTVIDWDSVVAVDLAELLADDDHASDRVPPLPSYDDDIDELDEAWCAAA